MVSRLQQPTERGDVWLTEKEDVISVSNKVEGRCQICGIESLSIKEVKSRKLFEFLYLEKS